MENGERRAGNEDRAAGWREGGWNARDVLQRVVMRMMMMIVMFLFSKKTKRYLLLLVRKNTQPSRKDLSRPLSTKVYPRLRQLGEVYSLSLQPV